jgi:hypothetical protein
LEFLAFVTRNAAMSNPPLPTLPVPFPIRFAAAVILIAWGARRGHPWTVPIAAGIALPVVWGLGFLPFFVAAMRLVDTRVARERWDGIWTSIRSVPLSPRKRERA